MERESGTYRTETRYCITEIYLLKGMNGPVIRADAAAEEKIGQMLENGILNEASGKRRKDKREKCVTVDTKAVLVKYEEKEFVFMPDFHFDADGRIAAVTEQPVLAERREKICIITKGQKGC